MRGEPDVPALGESLKGVETGEFMLRDNNSRSGSPSEASAWTASRMPSPRWLRSMRALLVKFAELSEAEARAYGATSCSALMPELARAFGMDARMRLELGPWAGASLRDPASQRQRASMADRYGAGAAFADIVDFKKTIVAMAAKVWLREGDSLPKVGGWERLLQERQ